MMSFNFKNDSSIIVFFSLIFLNIGNAQLPFEWEYKDSEHYDIFALYEHSDGSMIAAFTPYMNTTKIVRLESEGKVMDEGYVVSDSLDIVIYKIVYIASRDHYILLCSSEKQNNDNTKSRYFISIKMDLNLNVLQENIIPVDVKGKLFNMNYFLTPTENILLSVNIYSLTDSDSEQLFLKLDNDGSILSQFKDVGFSCYSIITAPNGYDCLGMNVKHFDHAFNFISKDAEWYFFIGVTNQNRSVRLSENKILIGSLPFNTPEVASGGAVLYIVDDQLNIMKKNWIKSKIGPTSPGNVFDITPDSSIFIATHESPFTGSLSFTIGKFDVSLNKKWQMTFEIPGAYRYSFWGMEATNDNGVLMYGKRWNWSGSIQEAYIIKFNEHGNLTWTHNVEADGLRMIKAYPNPSSGAFMLDIRGMSGKADLRIYDMSGRNVYVQEGVTDGETVMDLSALPVGMYLYRIYDERKEIDSGQWMKVE